MRIISGTYKGKQLATPKDLSVRPTTDKARNAVFSVLFNAVDDAQVLDLFCGTGSYGLEALSRGASSAVFIDIDTTWVQKNLKQLEITADVIKGDITRILPQMTRSFDLIFIDPPYGKYTVDELLTLIKDREVLAKDGIIVYEESIRTEFNISDDHWSLDSEKRYGDTVIRFLSAAEG